MSNKPNKSTSKANQQQQQVQQTAALASSAAASSSTTTPTSSTALTAAAAVEPLRMTFSTRSKQGGVQLFSVGADLEATLGNAQQRKPITPSTTTTGGGGIIGNFTDCESVVSPCNKYIAFADDKNVFVHSTTTGKELHKFEALRCIYLMWSPKSTFLVCYAHHDAVRSADNNMAVFRVAGGTNGEPATNTSVAAATEPVLRCGQAFWPALTWSSDEVFCLRRSQTSVVCVKGDLTQLTPPLATLNLSLPAIVGKEASLAVPTKSYADLGNPAKMTQPFVAIFTPQIKQNVAAVSVYRLPDLNNAVMTRTLGRGDRAVLKFSPSGTSLTALVKCDDDKTGASYYGSTQVHLVDIHARSAQQIPLATGEGIHSCEWSPIADEFIAVHGIMPRNKASLFNSKGEKLFSFSEEPRNVVFWSPSGKVIALGGNQSMPGDYQFYSREAIAKMGNSGQTQIQTAGQNSGIMIGKISEKSSFQMWLPDSRHFMTANLFTTLRVDNNFKIWKYTGEKVAEEKFPDGLFGVHCAVPVSDKDSMLTGGVVATTANTATVTNTSSAPWNRPYNSPVKDRSKIQETAGAWKPRHGSSAAAALLASSAPKGAVTAGVPASTAAEANKGPVGAQVVVKKKGGKR